MKIISKHRALYFVWKFVWWFGVSMSGLASFPNAYVYVCSITQQRQKSVHVAQRAVNYV